jgi:hypothetical protein
MTYNNTPLSNQTPAASQPQMQQNFLQIATSYNTDHVPLTSGSNVGQHKQVTFQNAFNVPPGPQGDPNQIAPISSLYTKIIGGSPQLFFQNGPLAANVLQITGGGSGTVIAAPFGQTFLEGGIQIKWGAKFPLNATGSAITINFVAAGLTSFPAACFVAFAIGNSNQRIYNTDMLAAGSFRVNVNTALGAADNFFWVAIGN